MNNLIFRKAKLEDLDQIKEVYNYAYNHMKEEGNVNQWSDYISFQKGVTDYINNDCFYVNLLIYFIFYKVIFLFSQK